MRIKALSVNAEVQKTVAQQPNSQQPIPQPSATQQGGGAGVEAETGAPTLEEILVLRIVKALADHNRFRILRILNESEELSCGEIGARFPIGQATVSHHLKVLVDCGLVSIRREGQFGFVSINRPLLQRFQGTMSSLLPDKLAL